MYRILLGICLLGCSLVAATEKRYDGFQVWKAYPKDQDDVEVLKQLKPLDEIEMEEVPVVDRPFTIFVNPRHVTRLEYLLTANHIDYRVVMNNVQQLIDSQKRAALSRSPDADFNFDTYNTLAAIQAQVAVFNDECPAELSCDLRIIGNTYEGRDLQLLKIGSTTGTNNAVLMMALIHAREWITGGTIMKIMDHMLTGYGTDPEVTRMLDTYDFYMIPVDNPDGYEDSWVTERFRRKNRSPNPDSGCLGTDLNRNNDFKWGLEGVSHDPCSGLYCGQAPGSELETQAYNNEIFRIQESGQTVWSIVDLHNFGQMWMHPWGYTEDHQGRVCERADDHDEMFHIAEVTAEAIMATHGTEWQYGTSCEVIYETTGATDDWAKGVAGVKYPFNPELRGEFFVTPDEDIELSFQEVWNGLVAMTDEIAAVHDLSGGGRD